MKMPFNKKNILRITGSLFQAFLILFLSSCNPTYVIDNPYKNVDWKNHKQYKANFHTHTTCSDGRLNPHTVVDRYAELGYTILAITDHNLVTYPWTAFEGLGESKKSAQRFANEPETMPQEFDFGNRDPSSLGIIAIQANELSRHHHMGSLFNGHNGPAYEEEISYEITERQSLKAVADSNGIAMLYHPGRYNQTVDWYVSLYNDFPHLIGQELYNQGDRYPTDRQLWDSILTITMPDRPVWGYSNDDMHAADHIGRNWNMLLLSELTPDQVRKGMEQGLSYYVYAPQGHSGSEPPQIQSIEVNQQKGIIKIHAERFDTIQWIANGAVVGEGVEFKIADLQEPGNYIRAVIHGKDGSLAGTQPFGIRAGKR
jgi:hypothetical protein